MQRFHVAIVFLFLVCAITPAVYADRGMIPVDDDVLIYEPGQRAILAWNDDEEIMILTTDVTSGEETLILEFLPLPSKPEVEAASFSSFQQIQALIWEEGIEQRFYSSETEAQSGSVELVFHEEIGPHNITVVEASDTSELLVWMRQFMEENEMSEEISLGSFEPVVENYMNLGFRYYVLDLITVYPEEKSIDPMLYRFNSSFLYYPLVVTSPVGGDTAIKLFLLTEGKVLEDYSPMQKATYRGISQPNQTIEFALTKGDLSKVDLRLGELFRNGAWLTVLKYDGKLRDLSRDLTISEGDLDRDTTLQIRSDKLIALCVFLVTASVLTGAISTLLITRLKKKST